MRRWGRHQRVLTASERARQLHSAWLTRALGGELPESPRIPARRVTEGGFRTLLRTGYGRRWATDWWQRVLERLE